MSLIARFFPKQPPTPLSEKLLAGFSAFLSIAILLEFKTFYPAEISHMILASMGATAVLLFATPHSTLVQPSAILGGHLVSASVGVAAQTWIPSPFSAAVAVGGAITLMHLLHCLHPPGGATALFAVTGGPTVWDLGFGYVLSPVGVSALLLLISGLLINNLRRPKVTYPAPAAPSGNSQAEHPIVSGVTALDIRDALEASGTYIDVTEDDLLSIIQAAELSVARRALSSYRLRDLKLSPVKTLRTEDSLEKVWDSLKHGSDGCVVILNHDDSISGIITRTDVIHQLAQKTPAALIMAITGPLRSRKSLKHQRTLARDIMSSPVITVEEDDSLLTVTQLLASGRFHHVPVVDKNEHLVGMVTHAHLWTMIGNGFSPRIGP